MNIDGMAIGEAREIFRMFGQGKCEVPFKVGEAYFIRTCAYHLTGRVRAVVGGFLVLDDAAWVADSGRFMNALRDGELNEVEPMPDGTIVSLSAITDAAPWKHELPKKQV